MSHFTLPDNITLNLPSGLENVAAYMWSLFCESTGAWKYIAREDFEFTIDATGQFPVTSTFELLLNRKFKDVSDMYTLPEGLEEFAGRDPVACCFYLINSLHENLLPRDRLDRYGRYPYKESIQYKNDIIEINYCQNIFNEIFHRIFGTPVPAIESKIFWSHDIDYLYSAWKAGILKSLRDRKYLEIPRYIIDRIFSVHPWDNLEEILSLEAQCGIHSTFFFLTEKGKYYHKTSSIDHADYTIESPSVVKKIRSIIDSGASVGLHKSAFSMSFASEIDKIPCTVTGNRNHFLKLCVSDHYRQIENSGLKYDASLGFAEHHGFRNSFGRPFQPYNLNENRPYSFVEYPLHLMDATFTEYLNDSIPSMLEKMKKWIRMNRYHCVISILLHNSHVDLRHAQHKSLWENFYKEVSGWQLLPLLP